MTVVLFICSNVLFNMTIKFPKAWQQKAVLGVGVPISIVVYTLEQQKNLWEEESHLKQLLLTKKRHKNVLLLAVRVFYFPAKYNL